MIGHAVTSGFRHTVITFFYKLEPFSFFGLYFLLFVDHLFYFEVAPIQAVKLKHGLTRSIIFSIERGKRS